MRSRKRCTLRSLLSGEKAGRAGARRVAHRGNRYRWCATLNHDVINYLNIPADVIVAVAEMELAELRRSEVDQFRIAKVRQLEPPVSIWCPHHNDIDLDIF